VNVISNFIDIDYFYHMFFAVRPATKNTLMNQGVDTMEKTISCARKKMLYALLGSSLLWQWPNAASAEEAIEPQSAVADIASPQSEFTLEGVEVTADKDNVAKRSTIGTKTDAALRDIPQSISVVTRDQLNARGVTNLAQALEYSAGITAQPYGNDPRWNWSLVRGFSVGYEGTRVDGLSLFGNDFAIWDFEPYGMDRLEILRGPASTLYGGGSPGGMFNWVSKRPTAEPLREIQLQGGSDHFRSAALDLGGQVDGQENLTFRLTALARDQDLSDNYSSTKRTFIAPSLAWKISKNTNVTFQSQYLKDRHYGNTGNSIYHPGDNLYGVSKKYFLGIPGWTGYDREQYYYGYLLDHKVNDVWSLHQNFRYGHVGTVYNMNSATLQPDGHTMALSPLYIYDETADSYTFDTYGEAKWKSGVLNHQSIVGIDYRKGDLERRYGEGGSTADIDLDNLKYGQSLTKPETSLTYKATVKQTGLYAQDQIKFGDKWTALLGGRHDHYDRDAVNPQTGVRIRQTADAFTGRVGMVYHAGHGLSPYISYSESFEPVEGQDRHGKLFDPTTGKQYELGIQYEPENMNARFTASIFDLRKQNVLTSDPLNTSSEWFNVQVGEITSKGLELEANMPVFKGLNLTASYTLLDSKKTKSSDPTEIGLRTQSVSRHNAALWLDTATPNTISKGLSYGAGVRYIGSRYNAANTVKLGDVVVADALIRYDLADWHYALNVRNLFDKKYEASYGYAGEERTVLLTATHHW